MRVLSGVTGSGVGVAVPALSVAGHEAAAALSGARQLDTLRVRADRQLDLFAAVAAFADAAQVSLGAEPDDKARRAALLRARAEYVAVRIVVGTVLKVLRQNDRARLLERAIARSEERTR